MVGMLRRNTQTLVVAGLVTALAGCGQHGDHSPPPLPPPVRDQNPPLTPNPAPPNHHERQAEEAKTQLRGQIDQLLREQPITFRPDTAELMPDAQGSVTRLAEMIKQAPGQVRFEIGGNAAKVDSPADAQQLSQQRAQTVADALTGAGIPADHLQAVGHGDARSTDDPAASRRADVEVR